MTTVGKELDIQELIGAQAYALIEAASDAIATDDVPSLRITVTLLDNLIRYLAAKREVAVILLDPGGDEEDVTEDDEAKAE